MAQTDTKSDIEIAREANMLPVIDIAKDRFGIDAEHLDPYGHFKAKISIDHVTSLPDRHEKAKLILVTAMTPTAAGEGKTTPTVGLADGLSRSG